MILVNIILVNIILVSIILVCTLLVTTILVTTLLVTTILVTTILVSTILVSTILVSSLTWIDPNQPGSQGMPKGTCPRELAQWSWPITTSNNPAANQPPCLLGGKN